MDSFTDSAFWCPRISFPSHSEPIAMRHPPQLSCDHFRVLLCTRVLFLPSGLKPCVWYPCGSSLSVSAQEDPPPGLLARPLPLCRGSGSRVICGLLYYRSGSKSTMSVYSPPKEALMLGDMISSRPHTATLQSIPFCG